jgi:hypothetical protein
MSVAESRHGAPTDETLHPGITPAGIAITLLAASGGILMFLAVPLFILPQTQAAMIQCIAGTGACPYYLLFIASLAAVPVHILAGGYSLALARDAYRSRLEQGLGLLILALVAFVSSATSYAGLPGFAAGVLLMTAGIMVYVTE